MVVSEPELIASLTRDHAAGKRIGFVRASFDVLKVDLVRALQSSAATSDRLVVAVIDDDGAPVINVRDRAELVDGLRGVDYVVICLNDRVERLLAILAPYLT